MSKRVSCLTITKDRPAMLARCFSFYNRQTWKAKEWVVVLDGEGDRPSESLRFLEALHRPDVTIVPVGRGETLGSLRNIAVKHAAGDVLCQWDDDDFNHPARIELQLTHLEASGAEACFFYDILNYFADTHELYWTDWGFQRSSVQDSGAPQTLMCKASAQVRYPASGAGASRGEDAAAQIDLYQRCSVTGLRNAGYLYTYVYHGGNTFERAHHKMIVEWMGIDEGLVIAQRALLAQHLDQYFPVSVDHLSLKNGRRVDVRS